MKKHYVAVALAIGAFGSLAFMHSGGRTIEEMQYAHAHLNGSGAPTGNTGAPGDNNCTQCHAGSVQDGTGINSVVIADGVTPVSDYEPGQTYNVAVTFTGAGAKNGFQLLALSPSNTQAGTMTAGAGNQVLNGPSGKKYVTHTSGGNDQTAWAFQWTAPATNVGTVTFYLATNQTNSNNNSSGDIIRLSEHTIGSFASVNEHKKNEASIAFASSTGQLIVDLNALAAGKGHLNLVDLSGKSVFTEDLGNITVGENKLHVRLPENIKTGVYIAHISVDNRFTSGKVAITR